MSNGCVNGPGTAASSGGGIFSGFRITTRAGSDYGNLDAPLKNTFVVDEWVAVHVSTAGGKGGGGKQMYFSLINRDSGRELATRSDFIQAGGGSWFKFRAYLPGNYNVHVTDGSHAADLAISVREKGGVSAN
jgi:hypothetical protein